ncbi:MAG: RsmE family RNA methyltransferase [bacterium]
MKHWIFLDNFEGGTIADKKTVHRLTRVLRLKPGDTLLGFDGKEKLTLRIKSAGPDAVEVETLGRRRVERAAPLKLTVAQALLKGKRWDVFLEKAAELGVDTIVPLQTENCVVRIAGPDVEKKAERWRRIVQSAAAQCRGGTVTEVAEPVEFADFVRSASGRVARFILATEGVNVPFAEAISSASPPEVILAVGPEGDFAPEEVEAASEAGFTPVTLGPRILRAETAAIVAAALALFAGSAFS